jgi:hypothetical protein
VASESTGARGTAIWAFNQFRQDALVSLMNDLVAIEDTGLTANQCKEVQNALEFIVNASTQIPDGSFFRKSVYQHLEKFLELYVKWNEPKGDTKDIADHRRALLKKLRKRRQKIARMTRKHQYILNNELDLKLLENGYMALGGLVKSFPEIFKDLAKAVRRFSKKIALP